MTTHLDSPTPASADTPQGTLLPLRNPPTTPHPPRRKLGLVTAEEHFVRWGTVVAGFALAWMVCSRGSSSGSCSPS